MNRKLIMKIVAAALIASSLIGCSKSETASSNAAQNSKIEQTDNKVNIEDAKKLALEQVKYYMNQEFEKAFKYFDETSLKIGEGTLEAYSNSGKEFLYKENAKFKDAIVSNAVILNDEVAEVKVLIKYSSNGQEKTVEDYLYYKNVKGKLKSLYNGIIEEYTFAKAETSKNVFYVYPKKCIKTARGVNILMTAKNNSDVEVGLGWAGQESEFILKTDKGTYKASNNGSLKPKTEESTWISFANAEGKIEEIKLTNLLILKNGLPALPNEEGKSMVVYKQDNTSKELSQNFKSHFDKLPNKAQTQFINSLDDSEKSAFQRFIENNNQQIQEEMIRQFNEWAMNEAIKSVTPFDMGGYVQGAGFNPSDTMQQEAIEQMNQMQQQMQTDQMNQQQQMQMQQNQQMQMDQMNQMNQMQMMNQMNGF